MVLPFWRARGCLSCVKMYSTLWYRDQSCIYVHCYELAFVWTALNSHSCAMLWTCIHLHCSELVFVCTTLNLYSCALLWTCVCTLGCTTSAFVFGYYTLRLLRLVYSFILSFEYAICQEHFVFYCKYVFCEDFIDPAYNGGNNNIYIYSLLLALS